MEKSFPPRDRYTHVLIGGTRDLNTAPIVEDLRRRFGALTDDFRWKAFNDLVFVSGGATGADAAGRLYAAELGNGFVEVRPHRSSMGGKVAPLQRNQWMIELLPPRSIILLYWDGRSPGTKDTYLGAARAIDGGAGHQLCLMGPQGEMPCQVCGKTFVYTFGCISRGYQGEGWCWECRADIHRSNGQKCDAHLCEEPTAGMVFAAPGSDAWVRGHAVCEAHLEDAPGDALTLRWP